MFPKHAILISFYVSYFIFSHFYNTVIVWYFFSLAKNSWNDWGNKKRKERERAEVNVTMISLNDFFFSKMLFFKDIYSNNKVILLIELRLIQICFTFQLAKILGKNLVSKKFLLWIWKGIKIINALYNLKHHDRELVVRIMIKI